jgi:hypothetical protein
MTMKVEALKAVVIMYLGGPSTLQSLGTALKEGSKLPATFVSAVWTHALKIIHGRRRLLVEELG